MADPLTNYVDLLGRNGHDRVTRFEGAVTSVTFDLYGCIQVSVQPRVDKDGKLPDGRWLDVHRLEPDATRAMLVPDFSSNAPAIAILGRWGRDRVSGFEGTVSSIAYHLSGKVEVALSPRVDKEGKVPEGRWLDAARVELIGDTRAMEAPKFTHAPGTLAVDPHQHEHGPAEKPSADAGPPV